MEVRSLPLDILNEALKIDHADGELERVPNAYLLDRLGVGVSIKVVLVQPS